MARWEIKCVDYNPTTPIEEGWEPFSIIQNPMYENRQILFLKRRVEVELSAEHLNYQTHCCTYIRDGRKRSG